MPQLGVQAVLEARVASLYTHEWPRALPYDSTHRSSLTLKGAKYSVAEAGAHPDPRGIHHLPWDRPSCRESSFI